MDYQTQLEDFVIGLLDAALPDAEVGGYDVDINSTDGISEITGKAQRGDVLLVSCEDAAIPPDEEPEQVLRFGRERQILTVYVARSNARSLRTQKREAIALTYAARTAVQGQFFSGDATNETPLRWISTVPEFNTRGLSIYAVNFYIDLNYDLDAE